MGKNKKKSGLGKTIIILLLLIVIMLGAFFGYSIYRNGGGLQGVIATVLGQDMEELEDLDPINILVLRNK